LLAVRRSRVGRRDIEPRAFGEPLELFGYALRIPLTAVGAMS